MRLSDREYMLRDLEAKVVSVLGHVWYGDEGMNAARDKLREDLVGWVKRRQAKRKKIRAKTLRPAPED